MLDVLAYEPSKAFFKKSVREDRRVDKDKGAELQFSYQGFGGFICEYIEHQV